MFVSLGNRIRKARRDKQLTQENLAGRAGISASFLGHIEHGTRIASVETLVHLANALGVDANTLLSDSLHVMRADADTGTHEKNARIASALLAVLDKNIK